MINIDQIYPEGCGIFSDAVRSVGRRGFHQRAPELFSDSIMSAQIAWIVAEAAEYETHWRAGERHKAAVELADMAIVAAQIAWLLGEDPDALEKARWIKLPGTTLLQAVGQIAHWATKTYDLTPNEIDPIWKATLNLQALVYTIAAQRHGMDADALHDLIMQKIGGDEKRGKFHGRGGGEDNAGSATMGNGAPVLESAGRTDQA